MIQACLFDFDGILADTESLHYQSFQAVLAPRDAGFSWEEYVREYIAFDSRQVFERALAAGGTLDQAAIRKLISDKTAAFQELLRSHPVAPLPGAVEAVHTARAFGPVALCTGAERADVTPLLRHFELDTVFQAVVTADDVARSKPDPACYRLAAEKVGTPPEQCLAIEDTPGGLQAARGAGCRTLGITTTHNREQLAPFADTVRDSLLNFSPEAFG